MFFKTHKTLPRFAAFLAVGQGLAFLALEPLCAAEQRPDSSKKTAPVSASRPKSSEVSSGTVSETVITATKRLLLDSKGNEATFLGEVKVLDPRFSLTCDKLTAYLKRAAPAAKVGAASEDPKARAESQAPTPGGGVEKAVAEGNVVIVQDKLNDKGQIERSIGRAAKAIYDSLTGDITLTGWPQVEQKQNTVVATEEGTVIILNSKGTMEVLGHSKSVLRNVSQEEGR